MFEQLKLLMEEAEEKINIAISEAAPKLDLHGLQLINVPKLLQLATAVVKLDLSHNNLERIGRAECEFQPSGRTTRHARLQIEETKETIDTFKQNSSSAAIDLLHEISPCTGRPFKQTQLSPRRHRPPYKSGSPECQQELSPPGGFTGIDRWSGLPDGVRRELQSDLFSAGLDRRFRKIASVRLRREPSYFATA